MDSHFVVIIKWNNFCGRFSFSFSFRFLCSGEIYYFKIKTSHWNMAFHWWFIISCSVYSYVPVSRLYSYFIRFIFNFISRCYQTSLTFLLRNGGGKFAFVYVQRLHQFNQINNKSEWQQNDWLEYGTYTVCSTHCIRMNEMLNRTKWVFDLAFVTGKRFSIENLLFNFQFGKFRFGLHRKQMMHKQNITIGSWIRFDSIVIFYKINLYLPIHVQQTNNEQRTINDEQLTIEIWIRMNNPNVLLSVFKYCQ